MGVKVSVIMCSYNRYPQNLFTLRALENQTFDHSKMEVILVDNDSTDETHLLKNYSFPFRFKYVHFSECKGRSATRNKGFWESEGDIIIFLDAEVILDPEFVERHYAYHHQEENLVMTGSALTYGTYTVYEKNFNREQVQHLSSLIRQKYQKFPPQMRKIIKKHKLHQTNPIRLRSNLSLISEKDVQDLNYKLLSFPKQFCPHILEKYGNEFDGFHIPWIFVITQRISLRRELFQEVGLFDEDFSKNYGMEDWELGYRLYKYGAKIQEDTTVLTYHQEHSVNPIITKDNYENNLKFIQKHPEFEGAICCLYNLGFDFLFLNEVITDYHLVHKEYPGEYNHFFEAIITIVEEFLSLAVEGHTTQLMRESGVETTILETILSGRDSLALKERYYNLVDLVTILLNK